MDIPKRKDLGGANLQGADLLEAMDVITISTNYIELKTVPFANFKAYVFQKVDDFCIYTSRFVIWN